MQILVDADACPVKEIIIQTAARYTVQVHMVCDAAHILCYDLPHVKVTTVDKGTDSTDLFLANLVQKDDICITGDYGLAALFLAKKSIVLHPNGFFYSNETIERMLMERHLSREMRKQRKRQSGHIKKRTEKDDEHFQSALNQILCKKTGGNIV